MAYLRDLKTDYETYIVACVEAKCSVLTFNDWLQNKVMELERRIARVEQAQLVNEGDGR